MCGLLIRRASRYYAWSSSESACASPLRPNPQVVNIMLMLGLISSVAFAIYTVACQHQRGKCASLIAMFRHEGEVPSACRSLEGGCQPFLGAGRGGFAKTPLFMSKCTQQSEGVPWYLSAHRRLQDVGTGQAVRALRCKFAQVDELFRHAALAEIPGRGWATPRSPSARTGGCHP